MSKNTALYTSIGVILLGLGLTYAPIPGITQRIVVVAGSELEEPLKVLETRFEQENPSIQIEVIIQGSQDMLNNYLDDKNEVVPTVLIPANGEILQELDRRWTTQNSGNAFYGQPQALAKTVLVGIAWEDRGKVLFPSGRFEWARLEQAMTGKTWQTIGGQPDWGSFDFIMTDPSRSNSGQLTLSLWSQAKLGKPLNSEALSDPRLSPLFNLVKKSVYQPPRSTDILLQEFIARGPNDADVATVYESIALYRWQQGNTVKGRRYQIYYLDPTIETVSTAAIVRRNVSSGQAKAAQTFLDYLEQPKQQAIFVQFGFRPINPAVDLVSVPNSPWSQAIPGAEVTLPGQVAPLPDRQALNDVIRLWDRAN